MNIPTALRESTSWVMIFGKCSLGFLGPNRQLTRAIESSGFSQRKQLFRYFTICPAASLSRSVECQIPKAEDIRAPAISLYRMIGFQEVEAKNEMWHSRWY